MLFISGMCLYVSSSFITELSRYIKDVRKRYVEHAKVSFDKLPLEDIVQCFYKKKLVNLKEINRKKKGNKR